MSTTQSKPRHKGARKSTPSALRQTDLGAVTPADGDFLYIKNGHIWRILHSAKPGIYDMRDAATDRLTCQITEEVARALLAKEFDVYQRVIT